MLWIIPLILFVFFLLLYIYYVYTRRINKKLIKKQKYYNKFPRLRVNFATNCRVTFMASFAFLVLTFTFLIIPHTNGTIKELKSREDLIYLYNNYYNESPKVEEHESVKAVASTIKATKTGQEKVGFDYKNLVYIENNILYLKKLNGTTIFYELDELSSNKEAIIYRNLVLVYSSDEQSNISIHSFETLEVIENIKINGTIESLTVDGNNICVAVRHKLSEESKLIYEEISQKEHKLNINDIHYISNAQFYQNLTLITFDSNFNSKMFSLCIGEYYLFEIESSIFIVENFLDNDSNYRTNVYLYDKTLGFVSRKVELKGYTYTNPELDKNKFKIYTIQKSNDISLFREFELDLNLWINRNETFITEATSDGILITLDEENVLATIKENSLLLLKETNNNLFSLSIDLNQFDLEILDDEMYLISDSDEKIIEQIVISEDGFEKIEVFSYEKVQNYQLLYSYIDEYDNFIFASNNEIVIVTIKEKSFEITNVYSSVQNQLKISIIDNQILIILESDVLVYDISLKEFKEMEKEDEKTFQTESVD